MTVTVDALLRFARQRIERVGPEDLEGLLDDGGIIVDIRPSEQRRQEGAVPGAVVVERNVLEWRFDPRSRDRLPEVRNHGQRVIVVCSEGYASSLAAASLVDLGFGRAGDLVGGYRAWAQWSARATVS
jgi:rhodanese-related sulfurtransferase